MVRYVKGECHSVTCQGVERMFLRRYNIGDLVVFGCMQCADWPSPAEPEYSELRGRIDVEDMVRMGVVTISEDELDEMDAEVVQRR